MSNEEEHGDLFNFLIALVKCTAILGQRELESSGLWLRSAVAPMSRS